MWETIRCGRRSGVGDDRVWTRSDPVRRSVHHRMKYAFSVTYNHMVVDFEKDPQTDRVFHALSHSVRRHILRRTMRVDISISGLARRYPMSFAAVQKHVAVLERAGLVTKERRGREQLVRPVPETVRRARGALEELELAWRGRVERMAGLLAEASADDEHRTRGHDR